MIRSVIILIVFSCGSLQSQEISAVYNVKTSGVKIGEFTWKLTVLNNYYEKKIDLRNSGIFSALYEFEGKYSSIGVINDSGFQATEYKQFWKTKKKTKFVEMKFNGYLKKLSQTPKEKELSRINLRELKGYFDPITSFINILNGSNLAKTVDGRRVYVMKKITNNDSEKIVIEIDKYKNIWADHKRNDLKKIEFLIGKQKFLPDKINVYFKDRVFKLKIN